MDSLLSFPVGLFHPLQHAGFDPGAPKLDVAGSIPVSSFRINQLRAATSTPDSVYSINAKSALRSTVNSVLEWIRFCAVRRPELVRCGNSLSPFFNQR